MRSTGYARGLVALAALLWGTVGFAAALAPAGVSAAALGAARLLPGGVALAALSGKPKQLPAMLRAHYRGLVAAALALGLFQWSFFAGAANAGSGVASIMSTAIAPIASDLMQRKRASASARWLGLVSCALAWFGAGAHGAHVLAAIGGGFAALVAGVAYAAYTDIAARVERNGGAGVVISALALLLASLSLLPAAWPALPAFASAWGVAVALYLGLATTALAYGAFARGLGGMSASNALALLALQPLTAAALGWLILDEPHAMPEVLALVMLLAASARRLLAARASNPMPETTPCAEP